jgi:UV DNA damage repair endonuclease
MHPGQYNQIGTKSKSVFDATVDDLTYHANILDYMELDNNSIICIHGGGVYNDKENTIRRWVEKFDDLPRNVKNRIAIENCELSYNIEDCLSAFNNNNEMNKLIPKNNKFRYVLIYMITLISIFVLIYLYLKISNR